MTPAHVRGAVLHTDEREVRSEILDYEARNAVRNLINELGEEQAHERLEAYWREEKGRKQ